MHVRVSFVFIQMWFLLYILALHLLKHSGDFWSQKAHNTNVYQSQSQGKQLRRDGFALAEERYGE